MGSDWIEHGGNFYPDAVRRAQHNKNLIMLKFRDNSEDKTHSPFLHRWTHTGASDDIVAYRIVENAGEPPQEPLPKKSGSDWVKHYGDRCPDDVLYAAGKGYSVELQFYEAEGETTKDPLSNDWVHRASRWDIVAYRIVETAGEPKQESKPMNPMASSVPIPDGWRAIHPDEMVERFDVIWNAEKRKGTPVSMWGYPFKNDNGTGLVIIRQLPNGYHRGCGSVDVGVDR